MNATEGSETQGNAQEYFSYIMQMTGTTKIVYKECSHGKKTQKHGHGWLSCLTHLSNYLHDSGTA